MKLSLTLILLFIHQIFAVSDEQWNAHKQKYNLKIPAAEEAQRRANYEAVDKLINEHNADAAAGKYTFTMGHNDASHLSDAEREVRHGYKPAAALGSRASRYAQQEPVPVMNIQTRSSVDHRGPCLSPIQDQKQCGSCWTFSATATLENRYCQSSGSLIKLSEQNLVDCVQQRGCQGGDYRAAWDYVAGVYGSGKNIGFFKSNDYAVEPKPVQGQDTEASYPYTSGCCNRAKTCAFKQSSAAVTSIPYYNSAYGQQLTWHKVTPSSTQALKEALQNGIVSVNIYASTKFENYKGGIFQPSECYGSSTNHAINVVGYGSGYWIMRNSYGTTWGEQGYARFEMSGGQGTCLMLSSPAYCEAKAAGGSSGGGGGGGYSAETTESPYGGGGGGYGEETTTESQYGGGGGGFNYY